MDALLETMNGKVKATSGGPLYITAEGATETEALDNLQQAIVQRLSSGARLVSIPFLPGKQSDPLLEMNGIFEHDPLYDQWQQAIANNRRELNEREGPW